MKNLTVFLVDDDIDDQEIFSLVIEEMDPSINCCFALDGESALQMINKEMQFSPDIILVDINMPKMNGITFLSELRKIDKFRSTPVFMYSTSSDPEIVLKCQRLGANGFIKKQSELKKMKADFMQHFFSYPHER